jgi:N-acetylglucosamine kinase-like BadF-type ATPase
VKYFLGIDAGGTKTHALIADENGQALGLGRAGTGNWEGVGLEGLTKALKQAASQALKMSGLRIEQIGAAGMGLAGYDWPSQREMILGAIQPLGLNHPPEIVNDATLGLLAGVTQGWGVSVVSGTGCNCRGWSKDGKHEGRVVGGGSHWSGEYAGAYDLVTRAMRAITFEWNKRGPATALSPAFLQLTGAKDLDELVEGVYVGKYKFDTSLVFKVFEVAAQGDPEALKVIAWAGNELGQMACGVIRQLGLENEPVEIVLIGSLYDGHPLMTEALRQTVLEVAPAAKIVRLTAPPVVGGVLLALEQVYGSAAYKRREKLLASTSLLLNSENQGL